MTPAQRAGLPVLVPDAGAIGMIGVIRSLGRAGYPVHACASNPDALGLQSNFVTRSECCPAYDDPKFLAWLDAYVGEHDIRCIVPSEGFLLAIRPVFDRYAPLLPIKSDPELIYGSLSKSVAIARLLETPEAAASLPPTLFIREGDPLPEEEELAVLGLPIFVKGDGADDREGNANVVSPEHSPADARARIAELRKRYTSVLVQGFVPGKGTGAYFLVHQGRIIQEFMNRCLHEVPHTGGYCSLRDSWWHQAMMEDARIKIAHLGWEGVAMLEYRWDPDTDQFWFIELNARFWAALHVALYAGVDFPRMLLDLFHGASVQSTQCFPLGLQVRYTIPFEVGYVASRWKDKGLPLLSRLGSLAGWFARFLNPSIRSDLWFPSDRSLYFKQWRRFMRDLFTTGNAPGKR
ncbi:hypothetical protein [Thauera sp. 63]|jgi:predicted ATP-grasp superfamily ATP-dependent carboligase|uniref:hypothetical protein n=1 Tax=Thauera sp. 63 TaxID=497321 RepID=UPI0002CFD146|nr:hypothetical protein [Thauera sp. 63]ENO78179.1 protein-tyrosine-phosphatase [Thauera sp. 63]